MAKDPAFLFYPNDWIGGTMGMTLEEKGAYMELLMMQFNRGHMTEHMIGLTIGHIWDKISVKFIKDSSGLWYNERLEEEKEKRKKYVKSRHNNKTGANQHNNSKKEDNGHMTLHMENENEDNTIHNLLHNQVKPNSENFSKKINLQQNENPTNGQAQEHDFLTRRLLEANEAERIRNANREAANRTN